jgi:hypothetical protein
MIKRRRTKIDTEEIIEIFKKTHGDFYDYSEVKYTTMHGKVIITCPLHGKFEQAPNDHFRGQSCPACGRIRTNTVRTNTTENFIKQAKEVHGEKYDYSKTIYGKNALTSIPIICPIHGQFLQTPNNHVSGKAGCLKCGIENQDRINMGVNRLKWISMCKDKEAILYILNIETEDDSFYKIGMTSQSIKRRVSSFKLKCKYTVLLEFKSTNAELIFDLEKTLLKHHKPHKYVPITVFDGSSECFTKIDFEFIKENT